MVRQIVSDKSFVGCLRCEARLPAIMLIAAFQRPSCAAANVFACRHYPDPDFVAAFSELDLEPLAEAVMRGGQEANSHGVSPLFLPASRDYCVPRRLKLAFAFASCVR
jgi:hypothetical protein